jgi:putative ABC transport system permease protein
MGFRETFRVALRAIRRNKVRSALTMLGVIIGVASVIAMIALGSGARAAIDEQIQSQGTALIYLSSVSMGGPGRAHQGSGSVQTLTT